MGQESTKPWNDQTIVVMQEEWHGIYQKIRGGLIVHNDVKVMVSSSIAAPFSDFKSTLAVGRAIF